MRIRRGLIGVLALFLIVFGNAVGCGTEQEAVVSKEQQMEAFLRAYWTMDYDRYQEFSNSVGVDEEALQAAVDAYYGDIAPYVTEELLEKLMANRTPYKYENLAIEHQSTYSIESIELTAGDNEMYDFEIVLCWEQESAESKKVCVTGEIRVTEEEECRVDYYYESSVPILEVIE